MNIDFENITQEELLNLLADFMQKYDMQEDPIIDVIREFSIKYDIDEMFVATELSDFKPFLELAENNLQKFKYIKRDETKQINPLELWE